MVISFPFINDIVHVREHAIMPLPVAPINRVDAFWAYRMGTAGMSCVRSFNFYAFPEPLQL
jgi:hypothetical protein